MVQCLLLRAYILVECPSNVGLEAEVVVAFPLSYSVLPVCCHSGGRFCQVMLQYLFRHIKVT